jgi:hypothetical protein
MICGDSKKSSKKKRGGFFERSNMIFYKCLNCMSDEAWPFGKFLHSFFPHLHKEYGLESFQEKREFSRVDDTKTKKVDHSKFKTNITLPQINDHNVEFFSELKLIPSLPEDHPARKYIESRKLPSVADGFGYTDKFYEWASTNTDKFSSDGTEGMSDHPRIIIPWFSPEGKIFAYQARAIGKQSPKYYTLILDTSIPKFYGMERVDFKDKNKRIYVVEGGLDSLYLPNCLAVGSSALTSFSGFGYTDVVYVFDAESRNYEITALIKKAIDAGKKVFIPPASYGYKDINDAILGGMSKEEIKNVIDDNTYQGLGAELKFSQWVKVKQVKEKAYKKYDN